MSFEKSTDDLSGSTNELNNYNFVSTMLQEARSTTIKSTHKIAVDILILDGVCNIQFKLNSKVHEKPIIYIFEDI